MRDTQDDDKAFSTMSLASGAVGGQDQRKTAMKNQVHEKLSLQGGSKKNRSSNNGANVTNPTSVKEQ